MNFIFDIDASFSSLGYNGLTGDNTSILNAMMAAAQSAGKGLYLTRPYAIDPTAGGITPPSGSSATAYFVLEFLPGAFIKNLPHNTDSYNMILVQNVDYVKIVRPVLHGARNENACAATPPGGPIYGFGICTFSCGNIQIIEPRLYDMYGDGIETGYGCHDIMIVRPRIIRAIRNGIGVLSCTNLSIWDLQVHAADGAEFDPRAAIDFEPMSGTDGELQNINIYGLKSYNMPLGVLFDLSAFAGSHNVSVNINDAWIANAGFSGFRHSNALSSHTGTINMRRPTYVRCTATPNNTGDGSITVSTSPAAAVI